MRPTVKVIIAYQRGKENLLVNLVVVGADSLGAKITCATVQFPRQKGKIFSEKFVCCISFPRSPVYA